MAVQLFCKHVSCNLHFFIMLLVLQSGLSQNILLTLNLPVNPCIGSYSASCSLAGVSRSVTLVVAYIMTVTRLGWSDALAAVKAARPCAAPNVGFQRQLQEFESTQADEVWGEGVEVDHAGCCTL